MKLATPIIRHVILKRTLRREKLSEEKLSRCPSSKWQRTNFIFPDFVSRPIQKPTEFHFGDTED